MGTIQGTRRLGDGLSMGQPKVAVAEYDFAVDGGAVGAITLRGDSVPSGAVITDSLLRVTAALTSGGSATVSVGTQGAADIAAQAGVGTTPWNTTGAKRGSLTATSAPVTTTAERDIVATVGTAALTAGAFKVYVWYVELA